MRIIRAEKIESRYKTGVASVWEITLKNDSDGREITRRASVESNRDGMSTTASQAMQACDHKSRTHRYPGTTGASATIKRFTWLNAKEGDNLPALVLKSFHEVVATQSGRRKKAISIDELQEEAALLYAQGYQAYAGMRQSVKTHHQRPFAIQEDIAECDMVERLDGSHQMPNISGEDGLRSLMKVFFSQLAFITLFHETQHRPHFDLKPDNTLPRLQDHTHYFERIAIVDLVDSMGGRLSCTKAYFPKKNRRLSRIAFDRFRAGDLNALNEICYVDFHQLALTTAVVVDQIECGSSDAHLSVRFPREGSCEPIRFSVRSGARGTFLGHLLQKFMAFNRDDSVEGVIKQAYSSSSREQIEPLDYWVRVYRRELEACRRRYRAYKAPAELTVLCGGAAREVAVVSPEQALPVDGVASEVKAVSQPVGNAVRKATPTVDLGCCGLFGRRSAVVSAQQHDVVLAAQAFIVQRY